MSKESILIKRENVKLLLLYISFVLYSILVFIIGLFEEFLIIQAEIPVVIAPIVMLILTTLLKNKSKLYSLFYYPTSLLLIYISYALGTSYYISEITREIYNYAYMPNLALIYTSVLIGLIILVAIYISIKSNNNIKNQKVNILLINIFYTILYFFFIFMYLASQIAGV